MNKLKGLGPIKLAPVCRQFNSYLLINEYYVLFAGSFVLIAKEWL